MPAEADTESFVTDPDEGVLELVNAELSAVTYLLLTLGVPVPARAAFWSAVGSFVCLGGRRILSSKL